MRILGVDPALCITGYGIIDFNNKRLSLVKAGAVLTSPRQKLPERLDAVYQAIVDLIVAHRPQVMVLEKLYAHYRHPVTAYILGQARGVICLACARQKVALVEYAATQVKKSIVGRGRASKYQVQRMVLALLGLNTAPKYPDVTDALALAISFTHSLKA